MYTNYADGWTLTVIWKRISVWRFWFGVWLSAQVCAVQEEVCQNMQILAYRSNCFHWDNLFYWEYFMQPEGFTLLVQTQFQQFVLTGAWNWPFPFQVHVTDPVFYFQSPGCILIHNAHFSQSNEFPMDKFKSWPTFFLVEWNRIFKYDRLWTWNELQTAIYVDFKGKYNLSELVSLPVTNNLQAVNPSRTIWSYSTDLSISRQMFIHA